MNQPPRRLYLFGAGVRARLVLDLIEWEFRGELAVEGYFDDSKEPGSAGPRGKPVLGSFRDGLQQLSSSRHFAFIATGTKRSIVRCKLLTQLAERHIPTCSLIPPSALISPTARVGTGAFVMPGTFVGTDSRIGHLFCAHGGVTIEHDARIGHNVMLGPGVSIAGGVTIGDCSFLGAAVTVMPNITIGSGVLVGAGSVVVRDIPAHMIAYGNPAIVRRDVHEGDEVPSAMEFQKLNAEQWNTLRALEI